MCMAPPGQPAPPGRPRLRDAVRVRRATAAAGDLAVRKENHVDHTLVDQTSVLRFIEDNWSLPRLGHGSFDAEAGSLLGMFDFDHPRDDVLLLNH